jgi:hypothetical protein
MHAKVLDLPYKFYRVERELDRIPYVEFAIYLQGEAQMM